METLYYHVNLSWNKKLKKVQYNPKIKVTLENDKEVSLPDKLLTDNKESWSPEHLYTAHISNYFIKTFIALAKNAKLDFNTISCKAKGKLDLEKNQVLIKEISIKPKLTISNKASWEDAMRILIKTEISCLISKAANVKVSVANPKVLIFDHPIKHLAE